jgi:hypothetical protein
MVCCDNCCLLLPLKPGAIALALLITLYSAIGAVILFLYGEFWYFMSYEAYIYAGIGMIVALVALITLIAMINDSYMWTRLLYFIWPFIIVLTLIRAGLMIARLNAYQSNIIWECTTGGYELYNATLANETWYNPATANYTGKSIPATLCPSSFSTLSIAFTISIIVDAALQIYLWFLDWRFKARLEQYFAFKFSQNGLYAF